MDTAAQPRRPNPISLRAQSNVETKAAARKGLLNIMMNKFSSTPLSLHESNELCGTTDDPATVVGDSYKRRELDMYQYDASLTKSERDYIRHIILSGDTNSIQSASVVLQNEDVFPVQQQLLVSKSSSNATTTSNSSNCEANGYDDDHGDLSVIANEDDDDDDTATTAADEYYRDEKKDDDNNGHPNHTAATTAATTTIPPTQQHPTIGMVRDSMIQQQLFRLHETKKDLPPNELIQRMSRQNSILTMDDSTSTGITGNNMSSFRHYRSMSPPPITEGEVFLPIVSSRSLDMDHDPAVTQKCKDPTVPMSVHYAVTAAAIDSQNSVDDSATNQIQPPPKQTSPLSQETALNFDAAVVNNSNWNPFDDISSWLDGSQGVEVTAITSTKANSTLGNVIETSSSSSSGNDLMESEDSIAANLASINVDKTVVVSNAIHVSPSQHPFRILGTSADDVSCHPHVLSPPLMESLLAFVPEYHHHHQYSSPAVTVISENTNTESPTISSERQPYPSPKSNHAINANTTNQHQPSEKNTNAITENNNTCQSDTITSCNEPHEKPYLTAVSTKQFAASSLMHSSLSTNSSPSNFWLKYSLVRDGPGLWTFLRQVRASAICILAIETTDGHVLGAYTSQPWRLSKGWYGNKDTFLWKMRRSRLETAGKSVWQQICQESEIQVYPYRTGNVAVQYCSNKCLMLGQGEIIPSPKKHNPEKPPPSNVGKHYGYALYLDKDLTSGSTSSSETFGNPCLLDSTKRGARFTVANVEVWTLTPHTTVADAEQSELSNLFLDGGRDSAHRLNFMNILVGGPI